ncbi:MAG TPA: nucleotidyl transferase AbiEii/AbiGii toxin family protein [Solirubrobacteraceae bacterium]|nr:nucleotidyl transferase AbiEii/AbiGii toxin family protein [Solirubrobacteraceae bacterium]
MIAQAYLNEWASHAPWPQQVQVEQDLILSRLIVEIARHELLRDELAFRGGTCLHKLHLPAPLRYSEDLDYVRRTHSGIKPYLTAIREIALGVGLVERGTDRSGQMVHIVFDGEPTNAPGRIRIKIETNIAETESFLPRVTRPYSVESRWWLGEADVSTFEPDELMATKLRALYQRRKGRDLFDLWLVLTELGLDGQRVVDGLAHYMRDELFSYSEFASNLAAKLERPEFVADIEQLTADVAQRYDVTAAADLVMEQLGSRLPGAPGLDGVRGGRWRSADA